MLCKTLKISAEGNVGQADINNVGLQESRSSHTCAPRMIIMQIVVE